MMLRWFIWLKKTLLKLGEPLLKIVKVSIESAAGEERADHDSPFGNEDLLRAVLKDTVGLAFTALNTRL